MSNKQDKVQSKAGRSEKKGWDVTGPVTGVLQVRSKSVTTPQSRAGDESDRTVTERDLNLSSSSL
jgi:hypothetical protein